MIDCGSRGPSRSQGNKSAGIARTARAGKREISQKSRFLETEKTLANDEVIKEVGLQDLRRPPDAFGDL